MPQKRKEHKRGERGLLYFQRFVALEKFRKNKNNNIQKEYYLTDLCEI